MATFMNNYHLFIKFPNIIFIFIYFYYHMWQLFLKVAF
jgi:hypothetical protein